MGLKRFIWRSTSVGRIIDTVKNIVEEGSVGEGIKRTAKEDMCEDNPLTAPVYTIGKYDGKIEGYTEASQEYETKLLKQAEEFLKQGKVFQEQRDAYEQLLDAYEAKIEELENKVTRTEQENDYLMQLLLRKRQLMKVIVKQDDESKN